MAQFMPQKRVSFREIWAKSLPECTLTLHNSRLVYFHGAKSIYAKCFKLSSSNAKFRPQRSRQIPRIAFHIFSRMEVSSSIRQSHKSSPEDNETGNFVRNRSSITQIYFRRSEESTMQKAFRSSVLAVLFALPTIGILPTVLALNGPGMPLPKFPPPPPPPSVTVAALAGPGMPLPKFPPPPPPPSVTVAALAGPGMPLPKFPPPPPPPSVTEAALAGPGMPLPKFPPPPPPPNVTVAALAGPGMPLPKFPPPPPPPGVAVATVEV